MQKLKETKNLTSQNFILIDKYGELIIEYADMYLLVFHVHQHIGIYLCMILDTCNIPTTSTLEERK